MKPGLWDLLQKGGQPAGWALIAYSLIHVAVGILSGDSHDALEALAGVPMGAGIIAIARKQKGNSDQTVTAAAETRVLIEQILKEMGVARPEPSRLPAINREMQKIRSSTDDAARPDGGK